MPPDERKALISAIAAVLMWSTVATGFKLGLEVMATVQLLFLGVAFSAAVFTIAALRTGWPGKHLHLREGMIFALLNPVVYYLVLFEAYDRLPAQIAQPLNYTWAIMLAVLAIPVLGQKVTVRTAIGIGIGYVGVLVLLTRGQFDSLPDLDWLGVLLAFGSTILWAGYWLFNARSTTEPAALMATSFLIALPILGIICLLGPGLPAPTVENLFYGAWVGLVEMGITFLLWQQALRLSQHAARLGQLIFLSPFFSLLMIGAVLGETIYLTSWIGLGIIVSGLLVTGRPT